MSTASTCPLPSRHFLFSWPVDLFTKRTLLDFLQDRLSHEQRTIIANLNLHALHCLEESPPMAELIRSKQTVVHVDGMPIIWLLKLKGLNAYRHHRLTYLDWAVEALALCERSGWRVAYIGSTPEIAKRGVEHFSQLFPSLKLKGWDGYFDMDDRSSTSKLSMLIEGVNLYKPDLLIVGMGMPRQEEFLFRFSQELNYTVAICSGAFFEYFTGGQRLPPRFLGSLGLEWLYRLVQDPRRYGRRYLWEPAVFLTNLCRRQIRLKMSKGILPQG